MCEIGPRKSSIARDLPWDVESQYDYFRARYYDARLGRFLAVDPHSSEYSCLSPFVYVGDNPLGFIDPSGMDSVDAQGAVTRQGGDDQAQKATKSKPARGVNETKRNEAQSSQASDAAAKKTYYLSAAGAFALAMFGLNCQIGASITFDPSAQVPDLSLFVSGGPVVYGIILSAGISGGYLEGGPSELVSPSLSVLGGYGAVGASIPVGLYDPRNLEPSFSFPSGVGGSIKGGPTVGIGLFSSQGYTAKGTVPPPSSAFWKR